MRGMRDVRNRKLTTNTFVSEEMVILDISCSLSSSYDAGSSDEGFQYETPTIHILVFMKALTSPSDSSVYLASIRRVRA